jgi:hypothetical protein
MTRPPTDRLYVNLSASQARRRLKGYGFGVRKVESVDRNQAAILHTATGSHLRELENLFADVLAARSPGSLGEPLENLRNLGPTSAAWLRDAGIHNKSQLQSVGPAAAYRLVKHKHPGANLNLLWALAGALVDKDWRQLTPQEKETLKVESDEQLL